MAGLLKGLLCAVMIGASSPSTASERPQHVEVSAAYVPLDLHSDCSAQALEALAGSGHLTFNMDRLWTLSDLYRHGLSSDMASTKIVFVMCPDAAQALFQLPGFRMSAPAMVQDNVLDTGPLKDSASPAPEEPNTLSRTLQNVIKTRVDILKKYASNPLIINAVQKANARPKDLNEIRRLDRAWIEGGTTEFIKKTLTSPVSQFLRKKVVSNKMLYSEAFVCDQQGVIIGAFPRTSDYYQGDEAKFTRCYANGTGTLFTGPLTFDESTGARSVQISIPIQDAGQCVGVLVMGLRNLK